VRVVEDVQDAKRPAAGERSVPDGERPEPWSRVGARRGGRRRVGPRRVARRGRWRRSARYTRRPR
jgi:hypothetical protein